MRDGRDENGLRRLSPPPLSSDARFMRSLSPPSTSALLLLLFRPLRRLNSELDYRGYFLGHLDGRIDPAAVSRMKVAAIIKLRGGDARRKNFAKVIPLLRRREARRARPANWDIASVSQVRGPFATLRPSLRPLKLGKRR